MEVGRDLGRGKISEGNGLADGIQDCELAGGLGKLARHVSRQVVWDIGRASVRPFSKQVGKQTDRDRQVELLC